MRPRADQGWTALVERDAERDLIDGALTGAQSGHGRVVLLYGQSGVGRSSLLRASVLDAESRGIAVLEGSGSELERGYGFGIVRQLLEARIAGLRPGRRRELLDDAGPAANAALGIGPAMPGVSGAAFDQIGAVHRLVVSLAAASPLLLAVDDLQWCDRPSLDFLCFLGHRATRLPVTIIAAWRRGEPGVKAGRLQALAGQPETIFLTPAPLSTDGVRSMLTRDSADGEVGDQAVDSVHAQTSGEPFLVRELVDGLRLRGIAVSGECTDAIKAITPESVRRNIVARLGRHSDGVRRFAQAVAVLADASLYHAAELAVISQDKARPAADALVRSGILRDDAVLAYAQPLLRAAVYDTLSSLECADLHHRAAVLLCRAADADPANARRAADHLLHTEPTGDPRFGEVLREAACRSAGDGAFTDARRYLARALGEVDTADRAEVLALLADLDLRAGDLPAAAAHAAEAISLASTPAARAGACLACSQAVAATQGWAAAVELLEAQAPELRQADPGLERDLQAAAARFRVLANSPPSPAPDVLASFEQLAGATRAELTSLAAWASHAALAGDASAARVARVSARVLSDDADPRADDVARYLAGRAALLCDAGAMLDAILARDCPPAGTPPPDDRRLAAVALRAQLALSRGDLEAAATDARAALDVIDGDSSTAPHRRIRADLLAALIMICLERADNEAAELALTQLALVDDGCAPATACLRIAVALARSQPLAARAAARAAATGPIGVAAPSLSWRPWAAIAHHGAGDTAAALTLATAQLDHARAWGSPSLLGRALLVRGVVDPGDDRLKFVEAAIAVLAKTSSTLDLARAAIEHGAALRRARRRREARDQLVRGADLANRCGAQVLSSRARAELVAVGARPRRAAFTGVGSLTRSELRVAQLAAAGLTNRAIAHELTVSTKTIAGQLTAVYRKLDVHDRVALAAAMGQPDNGDRSLAGLHREHVR